VTTQEYRAGRLLTSELKNLTIGMLQKFVKDFQEASRCSTPLCAYSPNVLTCINMRFLCPPKQRKAKVTDDIVKAFMDPNRAIDPSVSGAAR
jgi:tryptophanyl-tRNA synthetase